MKRFLLSLCALLLGSVSAFAATVTAVNNGCPVTAPCPWSAGATWDSAAVPSQTPPYDKVIIGSGEYVTYDMDNQFVNDIDVNNGSLIFDPSDTLRSTDGYRKGG